MFVALYAAYAFESRREIGAHLAFITAAAMLPLAYDDDTIDVVARMGLMLTMLWVTTAVVTHLREGMRDRQAELAELAQRDAHRRRQPPLPARPSSSTRWRATAGPIASWRC